MLDIVLRTVGSEAKSNKAHDTKVCRFIVTTEGMAILCTAEPQPQTKRNNNKHNLAILVFS